MYVQTDAFRDRYMYGRIGYMYGRMRAGKNAYREDSSLLNTVNTSWGIKKDIISLSSKLDLWPLNRVTFAAKIVRLSLEKLMSSSQESLEENTVCTGYSLFFQCVP